MCDCTRQFWLFLLVIIVKSMPKVDIRAAFGSRRYINAHCSINACCCACFIFIMATDRLDPRVRCQKQQIYAEVSISQGTVSKEADLCRGIHFPGYGVGSNRSTDRYPFPRVRCRKQHIYGQVSISLGTVSEATDLRRGIHFPGYGVGSSISTQRYPFPRVRCRKQHIYGQVSISQGTVSEATHLRTGIHFPRYGVGSNRLRRGIDLSGYGVRSNRYTQRYPFPRVRCRKQQIYAEVSITPFAKVRCWWIEDSVWNGSSCYTDLLSWRWTGLWWELSGAVVTPHDCFALSRSAWYWKVTSNRCSLRLLCVQL